MLGSFTTDTHARADDLLREAFDRRYRYPADMAGFEARVRFGCETANRTASVVLEGPGEVAVVADATGSGDDAGQHEDLAWLSQELRAISRLCWAHDYEAGEGRFTKSLISEPHPLGPLVLLHDDPHEATFRVRDGRISLMTRRQGSLLETVRVEKWHVTADERLLPARWAAEFWDDSYPEPIRVDRYWDLFKTLRDEMYPMLRRVETTTPGARSIRLVALREWRRDGDLLDPGGPAI